MSKFRAKIINYYDDVKNQIDIECEKIIADQTVSNEKKEYYNQIRSIFLSEIDKVQNFNLERLKTLKENLDLLTEDELNSILFKDKFCFHLARTRPKKELNPAFKFHRLGKLIITNIYLNETIRSNIRVSKNREKKNFVTMNSTDVVKYSVISDYLWEDWARKSDLVDLSLKEKNKLSYLDIQSCHIEWFKENDFNCIDDIMLRENLKSINLSFLSINHISKKMVSYFEFIESISLHFNILISFDNDGLFSSLKNLKKLGLNEMSLTVLPKNLFIGLENLKELSLRETRICEFEKNLFLLLPNLEKLDLNHNCFTKIKRHFFIGLEKLKILNLSDNDFTHLPMNAFENLKNLAFLNMRFSLCKDLSVKCFNVLQNLEFLNIIVHGKSKSKWINIHELNLPKLKYLAIETDEIPKMKNLNLEFLHVVGLEKLDQNSLYMYPTLKGLALELYNSDIFDSLKREYFSTLKDLAYLEFSYYELTNEQVNSIDCKIEFYKSLLCRDECYSRKEEDDDYHFEVSNYENLESFFNQELNVSECVKKPITEYHKYDVTYYYE